MEIITTERGEVLRPFTDTSTIYAERLNAKIVKSKSQGDIIEYYNIPAAFDIEVTSFTQYDRYLGTMYVWMAGIGSSVFYGRTWDDYREFCESVSVLFSLSDKRRLIFYVHNLAYEFQFIQKRHEWAEVFAIRSRRPVKCYDVNGIEFRCSYILSGMSLERLAKNLKSGYEKLSGDLDYKKIRHSNTLLTLKEWDYCYNDIRILLDYIQEKIEKDGDITKILLTKTSYVRDYCRRACFANGNNYRSLMQCLTITAEEYASCKRAFAGGFTHCAHDASMKIVDNVRSYDLTSSYPAVMVSEMFPMGRAKHYDTMSQADFEAVIKNHCCIADLHILNIFPAKDFEHPLSASKCWKLSRDKLLDNGRVVNADELTTTVTNVDYEIYKEYYKWDAIEISNIYVYRRAYLPKEMIETILHFYKNKTELKDVEGSEYLYNLYKEFVNSLYGMIVTDIVRDEYKYENGWKEVQKVNPYEEIGKYNNSKKRFLFYPWGVFVTAYARRNLFKLISEAGYDHIYCDTDSDKITNSESHIEFIINYNNEIIQKIEKCLHYYNMPLELAQPKNMKGIKKPLGIWTDEGVSEHFKSIGAKRYVNIKNGSLCATVAGCVKEAMIAHLLGLRGCDALNDVLIDEHNQCVKREVLNKFKKDLRIEEGESRKPLIRYDDEESRGVIVDYLGNSGEYHELSCAHLGEASFEMTVPVEYAEYINAAEIEIEALKIARG